MIVWSVSTFASTLAWIFGIMTTTVIDDYVPFMQCMEIFVCLSVNLNNILKV